VRRGQAIRLGEGVTRRSIANLDLLAAERPSRTVALLTRP
jgi:hypothetical protein